MRKGSHHDPAARAKMSAARKRALADPAVRAKMSAARKRALANPAARAKMSAASKRALADPAVRAKISAASKRAWAEKESTDSGICVECLLDNCNLCDGNGCRCACGEILDRRHRKAMEARA